MEVWLEAFGFFGILESLYGDIEKLLPLLVLNLMFNVKDLLTKSGYIAKHKKMLEVVHTTIISRSTKIFWF